MTDMKMLDEMLTYSGLELKIRQHIKYIQYIKPANKAYLLKYASRMGWFPDITRRIDTKLNMKKRTVNIAGIRQRIFLGNLIEINLRIKKFNKYNIFIVFMSCVIVVPSF